MIATADKQRVAEQYRDILRVINLFGDGAMLQDQLQQILILTGIYSRKASIVDALKKLEEHEIIKKVTPRSYRSQFILLKKYGIAFLKGKENSQQVSALKQISNDKYDRMVFRAEIVIQKCFQKQKKLEEILYLLDKQACSILYNKEQALEYVEKHSKRFLNNQQYKFQLELLKLARKQVKVNLEKTNKDEKNKEKPVSEVSVFTKLFRKNLLILNVKENQILYAYIGNVSIKSVAEAYILAQKLNEEIFKLREIKVDIYTNLATAAIISDRIENKHYNTRTKEMSKYTVFQQELIKQGMSTAIAEDITEKNIKAIAIDTNKYRTSDW